MCSNTQMSNKGGSDKFVLGVKSGFIKKVLRDEWVCLVISRGENISSRGNPICKDSEDN